MTIFNLHSHIFLQTLALSKVQQKRKKSFQYSGSMSTREVQTSSKVLCTRLHEDLTTAQSLFRVHEKLIHDKWTAKNNTKEKSHLLQLRPSMHCDQNAFLAVLNSPLPSEDTIQLRSNHKDLFLLPYMTIDTLAKDAPKITLRENHTYSSYDQVCIAIKMLSWLF